MDARMIPFEDELAGHELIDHTSEVTIRLRAPTFAVLVSEATRAFGKLVPPAIRSPTLAEPREFRVKGPDRAAGLVEWLNEMVYLCEVEQWLPVDAELLSMENGELHIRAPGIALSAPFVLVKAATLHRAIVRERASGLVGEVTLDV